MERIVRRVDNQLPAKAKALRVCAYARVSNGKDTMLHSLSAQVSHYSEYIQKHPGWIYCGVYTDEAISGTKNTRHSFNDLIEDCRAGKLDMVITKSISRFARNTVTELQVARELKELGVDIFFEEQSIHTMSADGELVLTILASFAQEEARSNSENQKWRIRKDFAEGKPWCGIMLGYRQEDGQFVIVPEEAEIVKRIFRDYLSGKGIDAIRKGLNEDGITTVYDNEWHHSAIHRILTNYTYTGNLILQKCYSENYLTKKKVTINGELPKYHVQNAHEAIIDLETFERVQAEIARRAKKFENRKQPETSRYTSMITCRLCGKHYRRKTNSGKMVWVCSTANSLGQNYCTGKQIPEATLDELVIEFGMDNIQEIIAEPERRVTFKLKNGTEHTRQWKYDKSKSWTPEMRARTGKQTRERNQSHEKKNTKTCVDTY